MAAANRKCCSWAIARGFSMESDCQRLTLSHSTNFHVGPSKPEVVFLGDSWYFPCGFLVDTKCSRWIPTVLGPGSGIKQFSVLHYGGSKPEVAFLGGSRYFPHGFDRFQTSEAHTVQFGRFQPWRHKPEVVSSLAVLLLPHQALSGQLNCLTHCPCSHQFSS